MKKNVAIAALVILALAAGAFFWLRSNLDGLIREAIETQGSRVTQARVSVGGVKLDLADGAGAIRGLVVGNPKGFKTSHAMSVGELQLAVDPASVTREVVVIRRIAILAPDVIYEKGDGGTNFDALLRNIADSQSPAKEKDTGGGKKMIVEELTIRNAKAQASAAFMDGKTVSVPLPDITLHNLGKAKGGVTGAELGGEVLAAMKQKLGAGVSFDGLAKSAGGKLDEAGAKLKGLLK